MSLEVEKLHGLHNTGMTMHQRFTLLAQANIGRRGKRKPVRTRSQTMNPEFIEALAHQLEYHSQTPVQNFPFRGRGRGRGGLRRSGSEGSLRGMPGLRKGRSNSFGNMSQANMSQSWRHSNGNLSSTNASLYNGSVRSVGGSERSFHTSGGGRRARGRGRGGRTRGRTQNGRVARVQTAGGRGRGRVARGVGRRGVRRNPVRAASARGWARTGGMQRGRGRGRGIFRTQTPKPVPTKEELDAQLEQYMAGTKAALDKELDEYMRHAMDFD